MHGLPKNMCAVPVIPLCIYMFLPYVVFMCVNVGCNLLIYGFESWITCSPHVVSLCDFAHYSVVE